MGFKPNVEPSRNEAVNEFVNQMKSTLEEAKSALRKSKDDMVCYYTPVYEPGDRVYLDSTDISTTCPSRKLSHRFLGPFEVERAVRKNAYHL
jgi:hypothetical protein